MSQNLLAETRILGRTGFQVRRLGISASYGVPTAAVERALEAGVNYVHFGSVRRAAFAEAIRNRSRQRDDLVLVVQSYTPFARFLSASVDRALRTLRTDRADVLLLGHWNKPIPDRMLDAARELQRRGRIRAIGYSTHKRPLVAAQATRPGLDIVHVRYNAAHPGAERDVFPLLSGENRPGIVSFTATNWGFLLKRSRRTAGDRVPTAGDCYRFVLSHPAVDVCMTGPANAGHVDHMLSAMEKGPMCAEELLWMKRVGGSPFFSPPAPDAAP